MICQAWIKSKKEKGESTDVFGGDFKIRNYELGT
jgi:hypothetical protein